MKFFTIFFFTLYCFSASAQYLYLQSKLYRFQLSNPDTLLAINIKNNKEGNVDFFFRFNDSFFHSSSEIIEKINKQYSCISPLSVMDFVSINVIHQCPVNQSLSINNPLVMINSLGIGLCSQKSMLMSFLCNKAGFDSRPVYLKNHVICYSEKNDRKELYDPDYNVVLKNTESNEILSLDDMNNLDFDNYYLSDTSDFKPFTMFYSESYRKCYTKYTLPENQKSFSMDEFHISLPKGSDITFPVAQTMDTTLNNVNYAYAKITIPAGYNGVISNPLILYGISGTCTVIIDSLTFILPDHEKSLINKLENINASQNIELKDTRTSITLYYYINNSYLTFRKDNSLEIYINDSNSVTASVVPVLKKPEVFTYRELNKYMPEIQDEIKRVLSEYPVLKKNTFITVEEMVKFAQIISIIPDNEVEAASFEEKIKLIIRHSGYSINEISGFLEYIESFISYSVIIKYLSNDEIIVFSKYLKNSRRNK